MSDTLNDSFFMTPRELTERMVRPNEPAIIIEVGAHGQGVVGILRAISLNEAGMIVGVGIQLGEDVEVGVVAAADGLYVLQGRYAEVQYNRRLADRLETIEEANTPRKTCPDCGDVHGDGPPAEVVEAIRRAVEKAGGRMVGGGVIRVERDDDEDDDDKGGPIRH